MRNNIASFEKTTYGRVKIMEKINTEFIFALDFAQNITLLLLVFSKEAILFLIYLLADKANNLIFRTDFRKNSQMSDFVWLFLVPTI